MTRLLWPSLGPSQAKHGTLSIPLREMVVRRRHLAKNNQPIHPKDGLIQHKMVLGDVDFWLVLFQGVVPLGEWRHAIVIAGNGVSWDVRYVYGL